MGTQDDTNRAEPQNEFISGFKGGAISQGKEARQSFVTQPGKISEGVAPKKPLPGFQNRAGSNPYQLTQQMSKNSDMEQLRNAPVEKSSSTGLIRKIKSRLFKKESGSGGTRQKVMVLLIPILFIIMIFMFRQVLWKAPKKTGAANDDNKSVAAPKKSSGNEIEWKIPDPLPAKIRDPIKLADNKTGLTMQENTAGNEDAGKIDVKSILYSEDKPSVVIGNKLVYLNQAINGVTVVEIHKDYIVFEKDEKRWQQKIAEEMNLQNGTENIQEDEK